MKRTVLTLLALATLTMAQPLVSEVHAQGIFGSRSRDNVSIRGEVADISTSKAGELHNMIPAAKVNDIRLVRISGVIDEADLKFLKTIANRGSVKDSRGRTVHPYLNLDLKRATFVKTVRNGHGRPLEALPTYAFYNWSGLRSIIMPMHLRSISDNCFSSCSKLEMVELSPHTEVLGQDAFRYCNHLEEVRIPSTVVEIGKGCFYDCKSLKTIAIPERLTVIAYEAFANTAIQQVSLPAGITEIGSRAFANSALEEILIPANVGKLAVSAFEGCHRLTSIVVEQGNAHYEQYGTYQQSLYHIGCKGKQNI